MKFGQQTAKMMVPSFLLTIRNCCILLRRLSANIFGMKYDTEYQRTELSYKPQTVTYNAQNSVNFEPQTAYNRACIFIHDP